MNRNGEHKVQLQHPNLACFLLAKQGPNVTTSNQSLGTIQVDRGVHNLLIVQNGDPRRSTWLNRDGIRAPIPACRPTLLRILISLMRQLACGHLLCETQPLGSAPVFSLNGEQTD